MKDSMKAMMALLGASIILSGCCSGIRCVPCETTGLRVYYTDSVGPLWSSFEELFLNWEVREFEQGTDVELFPDRYHNYIAEYDDAFLIPAEAGLYWTIVNDSLGIRDTVSVDLVSLDDSGKGACCYCGPRIHILWGRINGEPFSGEELVQRY